MQKICQILIKRKLEQCTNKRQVEISQEALLDIKQDFLRIALQKDLY